MRVVAHIVDDVFGAALKQYTNASIYSSVLGTTSYNIKLQKSNACYRQSFKYCTDSISSYPLLCRTVALICIHAGRIPYSEVHLRANVEFVVCDISHPCAFTGPAFRQDACHE
jgi:hypothetical protein